MAAVTKKAIKQSFASSILLTIAVILLLFTAIETCSNVQFICFGVLSICAILQWIKYIRSYVDFTIEQKLKQFNQNYDNADSDK